MKFLNKIKAFFCKENEPVEMDIIAAEIKEGKAFLHPKDDPKATYLIRSDDIRISLSEGRSIRDYDILSVMPKTKTTDDAARESANKSAQKVVGQKDLQNSEKQNSDSKHSENDIPGFERYKKRVFSVSLYPDEYDSLIDSMKEYGYKRADFLLACVQTARKPSIEKAHKQIVKTHKQMLIEQQELIKQQLSELEKDQPAV